MKIVVPFDGYNVETDNRYLIPCVKGGSFGFINKNGDVVIPAQFDYVLDDFLNEDSLVRVGRSYVRTYPRKTTDPAAYSYKRYGVLRSDGTLLIPIEYEGINMSIASRRIILRSMDKGYAVVDFDGNIVVPFGKYGYIKGFNIGIARVKKNASDSEWQMIDENGNEII